MPAIDRNEYENAQETGGGGGFAQVMPGAYVLRIQAVRTVGTDYNGKPVDYINDKQYVKLVYDIDEGEHAGHYSDQYFAGEDRDYAHVHYLSFKNMGYFKKQMRALEESNPSWKPLDDFEKDNWGAFIGKRFGAVLDGEVDTNDRGYDRWKLSVGDICSVKDVHDGTAREPRITDNRTHVGSNSAQGGAADGYYSDIPFSV